MHVRDRVQRGLGGRWLRAGGGGGRQPGGLRCRRYVRRVWQGGAFGGQPDRHPAFPPPGDHALVPPGQQLAQRLPGIGPAVLPGGELARVPGGLAAERRPQPGGVFPLQPVPAIIGRVLEIGPADVVGIDPDRPLAGVPAAERTPGVAVGIQRRAVVAQPAHLDAVMLDGAPLGRQEVVSQLRGGRDAQQPGAGHAGLIHLVRRQLQVRPFRHRQPVLPGPVIHQRDPLPDDVLQLVDEQERGVLHVLAAAVDVRALVGGQVLDQPFAQGLEKPLARGLTPHRQLHLIRTIGTGASG